MANPSEGQFTAGEPGEDGGLGGAGPFGDERFPNQFAEKCARGEMVRRRQFFE